MRRQTCVVFALLLALSASLATQFSATPSLLPAVPVAHAVNRTLSLVGNFQGWNFSLPSGSNPMITVNQGDVVMISLTAADTTHQFALDVDRDGAVFNGMCTAGDSCSLQFGPTSPTSVTVNTSSLSGTYTYFCTFHSSMVGSLIVNPIRPVGGTIVPVNKLALVTPYIILSALIVGLIFTAMYVRFRHREEPTSPASSQ